eukprot:g2716.t1
MTNEAVTEGIDCLDQLFKTDIDTVDYRILQQRLVAAMSYTASTAFYAGRTPKTVLEHSSVKKDTNALGIVENTIDGTTVTHLNKNKLKTVLDRVLKINLVSLSNIINKDSGFFNRPGHARLSDPAVVFTNGLSMSTSDFFDNREHVSYNSDHYILIRKKTIFSEGNDKLDVYVFDRDHTWLREEASLQDVKEKSQLLASTSFDINTELEQTGRHQLHINSKTAKNWPQCDMFLELSYEFLTVDEYCQRIGRAEDSHWLDEVSLENKEHNWRDLFRQTNLPPVTLNPLIFFFNKNSSTEGWIHSYQHQKVIVVGFKGTDLFQFTDLLTDIHLTPGTLEGMYKDVYELKPSAILCDPTTKVHSGFRNAYLSVRETVLETIHSICQWESDWLIIFTGHSLGGALATLAAYEVANRSKRGSDVKVAMINYGCPRLAGDSFVENYTKTVKVSYRFRAPRDVIPRFPHSLDHVPNLVTGDSAKGITVTFPGRNQQQASANSEDLADRRFPFTSFLGALTSAFSDHMEGSYFNALTIATREVYMSN